MRVIFLYTCILGSFSYDHHICASNNLQIYVKIFILSFCPFFVSFFNQSYFCFSIFRFVYDLLLFSFFNWFRSCNNCLEKGKGLKYRALGFRPLTGLGQKNVKKIKDGCFGVVRRAFRHWIIDSYTVFYSLFHGNNGFMPNPCFC